MKVLVTATHKEGKLSSPSAEALGAAHRICGDTPIAAVLVGGEPGADQKLIAWGADVVYTVQCPEVEIFQPDRFLKALTTVVERSDADMIILPADSMGRELAPRLAVRINAGLITDVIEVSIKDGRPSVVKPVYGGKAYALFSVTTPRAVVTLRPGASDPLGEDPSRPGEVVPVKIDWSGFRVRTQRLELKATDGAGKIRLEDARVVVAGGRGLGGPEPFEQLQELAQVLGGAVGASRAAVDAGWVPPQLQIGQTGKVIAPDLYIAVAISGASQHVAGMSGSKCVVAVNTDPDAPIFNVSTLGIVGDYKDIIPVLIEKAQQEAR